MWGLPPCSPSMAGEVTGVRFGLCPSLYHCSPLVVGSGHMWPRALRRKWDTGTARVVLVRWEMGKQGEGGDLRILCLCPRGYLRTGFGLCVPFSHPSVPAVWCTGICRPPPSPSAPGPRFLSALRALRCIPQPTAPVTQCPRSRARCDCAGRTQRRCRALS